MRVIVFLSRLRNLELYASVTMKNLISVTASAGLLGRALGATSGEFNVLAMNVAGLPAILQNNEVPGDKATNAGTIGSKFAEYGYDVIHVQEVRPRKPFPPLRSNWSSMSESP